MKHYLTQLIIVIFSVLLYFPAQAGFDLPTKQCVIFADGTSDDSKKEGGDKKEGEEEEEPDCD